MTKRHSKHVAHLHIFNAMLLKHYKILFKSKTTLLTMIAGPLIILLLTGLAFNTSQAQVLTVGIHSPTDTPLAQELSNSLKDQFHTEAIPSAELCKELVTKGYLHVCLLLPENLDPLATNYTGVVEVYSDTTQYNLAYLIIDQIDTSISQEAGTISKRHVNELIQALQTTETQLSTTQTQLQQLSTTINQANSKAEEAKSTSTTALSFEAPVLTNTLGRSYNELIETANSVQSAVQDVDDVTDEMLAEAEDLQQDIDSLEDVYEEECEVESPASDCEEQQEAIDTLLAEKTALNTYLAPLQAISLGEESIALQLALQNITPEMQNLQNTLDQAGSTISSAQQSLNTINTALSTTTTQLNTASTTLQSAISSVEASQQAIQGVDVINPDAISTPITTHYNELAGEATTTHKLFPSLLGLFVMLVSILLSATFIIIEKNSSAFIRNNIAPISRKFFPITSLITLISIILAETIILSLLAQFIFEITLTSQALYLLLAFFVGAAVFVTLGMAIGFLFNNEQSVTLTSIFLATALMLFSPLIFPLQSMTKALANIASYNPYVITSELFKRILLFGAEFDILLKPLLILAGFTFIFIIVFSIAYIASSKDL